MSISLQRVHFLSLSPLRRMHHYVQLQHDRHFFSNPSRSSRCCRVLHCSRSLNSLQDNGSSISSNKIRHNPIDSSVSLSHLLAIRTNSQNRRKHNNGRRSSEHPVFGISSRYFSSSSAEKSEENIESNSRDPTQLKDNKMQQTAANGDDSDRYYYLIKQKYSPSRHQKYRPSKKNGTLEKTVSNKPLKDRIIQSNSDVVAYFMPKGLYTYTYSYSHSYSCSVSSYLASYLFKTSCVWS